MPISDFVQFLSIENSTFPFVLFTLSLYLHASSLLAATIVSVLGFELRGTDYV
jgi:hypothetical protein